MSWVLLYGLGAGNKAVVGQGLGVALSSPTQPTAERERRLAVYGGGVQPQLPGN